MNSRDRELGMGRTISRRDFLNGVGARHNTLDVGSTIPIEVLRGGQIIHSMITTTSLRPTLRGHMRRMSLSPARLTP